MSYSPSLTDLSENMVAFTAHPVASSLIWCASNNIEDSEALIKACSYMVSPGAIGAGKTFVAERYGGSGIHRNGGGARCGFDGRYQVKGIGPNPLVGRDSDRHHSNGALAVNHAIYEALWGEILSQSLPYSAVQTRAILLTDHYIDLNFERLSGNSRRALLVRDPVIRPAHFERAPYFRPQAEFASHLMHDANRVKWLMRLLPDCLPTPPTGFSKKASLDLQQRCLEGLSELSSRQAQQMAFCRTRFLMLTTSPSNMAIDGRLMDFNGLNCLFPGDNVYDFEYQLKITQLMKEPAILQQGGADLCLYLGKYLFDTSFTSIAQRQINDSFRYNFRRACYRGYLELLGIPIDLLPPKEIPVVLERLVDCFLYLLTRRSSVLHCSCDTTKRISPLQQLVMTLILLSQGQELPDYANLSGDEIFNETLRAFIDANHWLVKTCNDKGLDATAIQKKMGQQALQKLQPRACLGKAHMLKEISALLESHADDSRSLRQALREMEVKILAFTKDALGCQMPFHHTARENDE